MVMVTEILSYRPEAYGVKHKIGNTLYDSRKVHFCGHQSLDNAELQFDSEAINNDFAGEILAPGDINADGFDDLMFASSQAEYPIGSNTTIMGMSWVFMVVS